MTNLKEIEENYKSFSDARLLKLAENPRELDDQIVEILLKELDIRGETAKAEELRQYLITHEFAGNDNFSGMSHEELEQMIIDRLESGESLESISLDFKDNGRDIQDVLNAEYRHKEKIFKYMTRAKAADIVEGELTDDVTETFGISKEEAENLDEQLKKRGEKKLSAAYIIIAVIVLIMCIYAVTSGRVVFPVLLGALCILLIYRGSIQKK